MSNQEIPPSEPGSTPKISKADKPEFGSEYPAPWPELIRFETEAENGRSIWMTDLGGVDQEFEELKARAEMDDLDAGLRLFEFATHWKDHGYRRTSITDASPPVWTEPQRMFWARLAARAGSHLASMQLLANAESLLAGDPLRDAAVTDAINALTTTSEHGWLESLVSLAALFDRGVLAPRNPCKAFAYFQIAVAASGSDWADLKQRVALLRAGLSQTEIAEARELQESLAHALKTRRGMADEIVSGQ